MLHRLRHLVLLLTLFSAVHGRAQWGGSLYGIHNPTSGMFAFAALDLSTMAITDLDTLPMNQISSMASGTVDTDLERFLFCTGTNIFMLDPYGLLPTTVVAPPIGPGAYLCNIEYDPCTASLYGFVNDPPDSVVFARYHIATNTFQTLLTMPNTMSFMMGAGSYIDPITRVYGFENINNIMGIDVDLGTLLYDTPMIDPPGESFGHISLDCSTGQVLGTSFGAASEGGDGKWVSTVDPLTGIVTHLSSTHTPNALMKPAMTGSCVDQVNGVFYWGGVNGAWVGGNTTTGNIVLDDVSTPATPLFCVNHFSNCACGSLDLPDVSSLDPASPPYPIPATDVLYIFSRTRPVQWTDMAGRSITVPVLRTNEWIQADVSNVPPGMYCVRSGEHVWRVVVE
ncbi:MAG: hypothetical protein IPO17_17530 [Flavobacteriales bacterium]|nr:hypothetical protein [Flavobacteriales bacterium]